MKKLVLTMALFCVLAAQCFAGVSLCTRFKSIKVYNGGTCIYQGTNVTMDVEYVSDVKGILFGSDKNRSYIVYKFSDGTCIIDCDSLTWVYQEMNNFKF